MDLSVLIVNYNARDHLSNCLHSLHENTKLEDLEVVVVDNASSDGTPDMLARDFPEVRVIASGENLGFARANNLGMREAKGHYRLLLNNDTLIKPGSVDRMVRIMRERPDVGVLGPLLRNEDGTVQISYGNMVSLRAELFQKLLSQQYESGSRLARDYIERRSRREAFPDWVSGACLMMRADLPEEARFFDETFFMYLEDVDLCYRVRKSGYRVMYTPEAEIVHLKGKSVEANPESVAFEYRRSQLFFYSKHYGPSKVLVLKGYLIAKAALGWVLHPAERSFHRRLLELLRTY